MKKFILSAILPIYFLIFALFPFPMRSLPVRAQTPIDSAVSSALPSPGSYACILSDSTFFYSSADGRRGVFLLPKTYYVRLVEYGADYCKIEYLSDEGNYKKLTGYARTTELTFVDYVPKLPYLYYSFEVSYRIGDSELNDSSFLTEITVDCIYYGDYLIGSEAYCYVRRGDTFGYVPKPLTLSYTANTEYADYLAAQAALSASDAAPDSSTTPEKSSSPIQIAILVVICLLVPVLAALILKPPKRPFYDMTNDE
ncbi:MAG: hypothetical protein IJ393_06600 [Clostridia bacterium]|nr:hypothetical protein [Clostridia bacterium]